MERTRQDYDNWNDKKKTLNTLKSSVDIQVGEVWRYYCGVNIGHEIGKGINGDFQRVCLVLKTNLKNDLILIAPLSTKVNKFSRGNTIKLKNYDVDAWVIANQVCLIDRNRFSERRPIKYNKNFIKKVL